MITTLTGRVFALAHDRGELERYAAAVRPEDPPFELVRPLVLRAARGDTMRIRLDNARVLQPAGHGQEPPVLTPDVLPRLARSR